MEDWKHTVRTIRQIKTNLAASCPGLGPPGTPVPPASLRDIAVAERRLGQRLPPSYRSFLHEHDGWPLFFHGASLLGTRELTTPGLAEFARVALAAYDSSVSAALSGARAEPAAARILPFGVDPDGTVLFAFDPAVSSEEGEMPVIAWINGLGERYQDFAQFLSLILEMLASDLVEQPIALRRTA
jgi:hypothetical protein